MDIKEFLFNHRYIFIILVVLLFLSLLAYLILHFSGYNNKTISDVLDTNTPNIVKKLYCNDNLCLNNSSCVELLDDYKCICQYGYYGKNCNNYDIDEKEDEIDIDIYREEYIDRGRNRPHGNSPGPSPGPVPIPATPFKYNCCNTTYECLQDSNGSYTSVNALQDCNNNCKPPEPTPVTLLKYKCDKDTFTCKFDEDGTETKEECQTDCKPDLTPVTLLKYKCDKDTFTCKFDEDGTETKEECQQNCKRPDPTPVTLETCTQYGANKSPFKCKPSGSLKKNASNIECPKASNDAYYDCNYNLCCDDSPDPPQICPSNCSGKKCVEHCSGIITPTDCNKSFQKNGNSCIYHNTSHKCIEDPDERSCSNCSCTVAPPPPKTSCSDTNKCDATNSVSVDVDDYPELTNGKFNIRIKNTYSKPITIWLDDLPFAKSWITDHDKANIGQRKLWTGSDEDYNSGVFTGLRNYTDTADTKIMGNNWESIDWQKDPNAPSVEKYSKQTGTWIPIKTDFKYRFFKLDVNDVLVITPPHSDIYLEESDIVKPVGTEPKPYQCFYQIGDCDMEGVNNWRGTCTSVNPKNKSWYQKIDPAEIDNLKTLVNASFSLNCGGSGMYITPCLPDEDLYDVIDTGGLSRIEYNINGGEIYFNLSAVDGINSDFDVAFNPGNKSLNTCDADRYSRKSEAIDNNDECPNKNALKFKNEYISSCQSIKYWKPDGTPDKDQLYPLVDGTGKTCDFSNQSEFLTNVKKVKLYNFKTPNRSEIPVPPIIVISDITAYLNSHNNIGEPINASNLDSYLAKCPGGDAFTKTLCHLWWDDPKNDCAQQWINFASDPKTKQQYSWAYDEMKINSSMLSNDKKTIPFDENGNPLINIPKNIPAGNTNPNSMNDIVPLLHCQLADLTSNPTIDINISNIINSKDEYTTQQIAKCKSALGNYSMCSNASKNNTEAPFCNINWKSGNTGTNCGHEWDGKKIVENKNYCLTKSGNNLVCASGTTEQKCMSVEGNIWCEPCHMGIPFDANVVTKKICNIPCKKGDTCPNKKKCDNTLCCDGL